MLTTVSKENNKYLNKKQLKQKLAHFANLWLSLMCLFLFEL